MYQTVFFGLLQVTALRLLRRNIVGKVNMELQLDETITVLLISKISSTCFGQNGQNGPMLKEFPLYQNILDFENSEDFRHNSADPVYYMNTFEETIIEKE
jgi:hypothetical protein